MTEKREREEWIDAFIRWLTKHSDAQGDEAAYEAEMEADTQEMAHGMTIAEWDRAEEAARRVLQEWKDDAANDEDGSP